MDYELGLERLKQLLRGTASKQEFLVYEGRLRENLDNERRYGTTDQRKADRAQIIDQLNRLAEHVNTSFNDLCRPLSPKPPDKDLLTCTFLKRKELKYGFTCEFQLKSVTKEHILQLVVDYGWKNTLYLDQKKLFDKRIGYIDSIWTDIEAHLACSREGFGHLIFWCNFIVDGHSLEYCYYCKKNRSRSEYTFLIKEGTRTLFERTGYYLSGEITNE